MHIDHPKSRLISAAKSLFRPPGRKAIVSKPAIVSMRKAPVWRGFFPPSQALVFYPGS